MDKYDDYGVPLTKREVAFVALVLCSALTCWIAIISFAVHKFLQWV